MISTIARVLMTIAMLGTLPAAVASPAKSDEADLAAIKRTLSERFKDIHIVEVKPSPMPGLYEIFTGTSIAYSDRTADHLILGPLVETATGRNLSAERVAELNSVDFNALPFDKAIKVVRGTGERKLVIFADPDCPYCRKLERESQALKDVTFYTFLYPIASLHPDAKDRAHDIWCAPNRAEAWTQWMLEKKAPAAQPGCTSDPLDAIHELGTKLNITGTPTMYLSNGRRVDGAIEVTKLEAMIKEAASQPKQASLRSEPKR